MNQKQQKKVYLFFGNQDLLIQEHVNQCVLNLLEGREKEWSFERYDLFDMVKGVSEESIRMTDELIMNCETQPMFSDRKVFRLDHAEEIKKINTKNSQNHQFRLYEAITRLLKDPPKHLFLVLSSSAIREQDFSIPLYQLLKEHGEIRKFIVYEDQSPFSWLQQRVKEKKLNLNRDSVLTLIEIVGNDLNYLDQELDKLRTNYPDGQLIDEETLKTSIRGHKHASAFRMVECLAQKHLQESLEILDQQLREAPRDQVRLFSLVTLQFRRLLNLHYLQQMNVPESTLPGKIRLPPFLAKQALKQASHFTCAELESIMVELAQMDLSIKFYGSLSRLMLETLFQKICAGSFRYI
jgi:DNA polymerase III subunit delta